MRHLYLEYRNLFDAVKRFLTLSYIFLTFSNFPVSIWLKKSWFFIFFNYCSRRWCDDLSKKVWQKKTHLFIILYYTMTTNSKKEVLNEAFATIEKKFGKWAIMRMWDNSNVGMVNTFHTGSYVLDLIAWWWFPEWRVIEVYGPESSGKTSIALHAIAEVQKRGEVAAFIDAEHALDPVHARNLWVNIDDLLLSQPDFGEQALQIAEELAKSWAVRLIVIDSVSALVPRAEVEWEMWDSYIGLQARMMSQWLRKITSILAKTGTTCIFINQIRMKIGVMFGSPETTSGGQALKFFSSQRLEIRRWEKIMEDKEQIWYMAKVKTVKNKVFAPFKRAELPFKRKVGYDKELDIIEASMILNLISRSWAFYTVWDQKIQWKEKLAKFLIENGKIREKLELEIQKQIKDMRSGKKVLDDAALEKADKDISTDELMGKNVEEKSGSLIDSSSTTKKKSKK